ncbi:MAG: hypothetical protein IJU54_01310 [Alphaproteobacteria bacterium]|nr:hypothetical protein [Alphaproteobacteria bacterium]
MTKIFSKLFLCGILLSSINGYCTTGLSIALGGGIPLDNNTCVEIDASTYTPLSNDLNANYNIIVGDLMDNLSYSDDILPVNGTTYPVGSLIVAKDFVYANAITNDDGTTWAETHGSMKIIPIKETDGYYHISEDKTKIYQYDAENNYTDALYNYHIDGKWYEGNTQDTEANIRVITIDDQKFKIDNGTKNILFNGNVAYKDGNTWKLFPSSTPLKRAVLDTSSQKLTMNNYQDGDGNTIPSKLTVKQVGQIAGDSVIDLKDANTDADPEVFETYLSPEPGSIVGEEGKPVSVNNGTVTLKDYLARNDLNNPVPNMSGKDLYLTANSKVSLFSNYMLVNDEDTSASTTNTLINNFNKSTKTLGLFCNVTSANEGKITISDIPYVISDTTNYYKQVNDIDNLTDGATLYFNAINQDKIKGLFKDDANIQYDLNASTILTNLVKKVENLNDALGDGETQQTIKINALSFQQWDPNIDIDSFNDSTDGDKKFKIEFIKETASSLTPDVNETTNEADDSKTDKTVTVDYNTNPADKYVEADMSDGAGDVTINYSNLNGSTIVPNPKNNSVNGGNGPVYNLEDATVILDLSDDTNMSEVKLTNCKVIVRGHGHTLNLHVNMDALSSIKYENTKVTERISSFGE